MPSTVVAATGQGPDQTGRSWPPNEDRTMSDPFRDDVTREAAAMAHQDAFGSDKKAARALGCARRSANRYSHEGHPDARRFATYAEASPHPERIVAFAQALLRHHVRRMTRDQLIREYREALLREPTVEAEDRLHEIDGSNWMVRARASQANAGCDELLAALELEFAARSRRDPSYAEAVIDAEVLRAR